MKEGAIGCCAIGVKALVMESLCVVETLVEGDGLFLLQFLKLCLLGGLVVSAC